MDAFRNHSKLAGEEQMSGRMASQLQRSQSLYVSRKNNQPQNVPGNKQNSYTAGIQYGSADRLRQFSLKMKKVRSQIDELISGVVQDAIAKERDLYFKKLQEIKTLCNSTNGSTKRSDTNRNLVDNDDEELRQKILRIIGTIENDVDDSDSDDAEETEEDENEDDEVQVTSKPSSCTPSA